MINNGQTILNLLVWGMLGAAMTFHAEASDHGADAGKETPFVVEHYAIASEVDYLDGPRLEAFGSDKGRLSCNDKAGNVYIIWKYTAAWIRCITVEGQMKTIGGDDRWPTDLKLSEGPASYFPNMEAPPKAGALCLPEFGITAEGYPLQGEDKGSIYVYWAKKSPYRIYKSKTHGGRWWFKRLGVPGKAKPPEKNGASALIPDVDLTNARVGNGWIACNGNMYTFDSVKNEITCVLTLADYEAKIVAGLKANRGKKNVGKPVGAPEHFLRADDGSMYLLYYAKNYPIGSVFKISADRRTCALIVQHSATKKFSNRDGRGLETRWHCGPAWMRMSKDTLLLRSIDSATVRRWQNGRVAALCYDGEWREHSSLTNRKSFKAVTTAGYHPGDYGLPYVYIYYAGEKSGNDCRFYRIGPVDFTKDIVGPRAP